MATNYTENYGLCQWEAGDSFVRTEFNQDNQKIDAALGSMLHHAELIRTVTVEVPIRTLEIFLADLDWSTWEYVILMMTEELSTASGIPNFDISVKTTDGKDVSSQNSNDTGRLATTAAMPFLLVLLPLRDGARQVCCFFLGAPSGVGMANCTFNELQAIQLHYASATSDIRIGTRIQIWGMK